MKEWTPAEIQEYKQREAEHGRNFREDGPDWYDAKHGVRSYLQLVTVRAHLRLQRHHILLDVGSGLGRTALAFAPHVKKVIAADISPHKIRLLKNTIERLSIANIEPVVVDASETGRFENAVDRACSVEVLQHIPSHELRQNALSNIRAALRDGGRAVVVVYRWNPQRWPDKEGEHEDGRYRYAFDPQELDAMLRNAGFSQVRVTGCNNFPPGVTRRYPQLIRRVAIADQWFSRTPISQKTGEFLLGVGIR